MKKIYVPMIRYGDKEFDEGFIGWGFQSMEEQIRDARAVMDIISRDGLKILDIACGLGTYHKVWLEAGHTVVGTDLSETFITMARNTNTGAAYRVENFYDLEEENEYDLVTMIDTPVEDEDVPRNVYRALKPDGSFVFQLSNPVYKHLRGQKLENSRSWKENEDRTFLLTRHEYNEDIDRWEYEEWHLNLETGDVLIEHNFSTHLTFSRLVDILLAVGFCSVSILDADGRPYTTSHEDPKNFFCVARKGMK
ncbi:MAG: class I SAM-dependent methyltransferase [Oscillospiraceae bacterium]|jgi:SAM-dependent methyltransferase|nr:class I SAM-dependent methyltransferase [Oscillospiraceae bacterium]